MSINLKIFDLRCFITLCEQKSFTKAAEQMYISQPPFSRIIQKLEFEMRGLLIERKEKSFILTPLGQKFLEEAKLTVESYYNSMIRIENVRSPTSNELKIGYTKFASELPDFFELLNDLSQQVSLIDTEEIQSQELFENIKSFKVDIGIFHFPLYNIKGVKTYKIQEYNSAVLFSQQICCFRQNKSYTLILNEDKIDKIYNEYLLTNFPKYNLLPIYKTHFQLAPHLALKGEGLLIYPEPIAKRINTNNIFTFEQIPEKKGVFGLFIVTNATPIKKVIESILLHYI